MLYGLYSGYGVNICFFCPYHVYINKISNIQMKDLFPVEMNLIAFSFFLLWMKMDNSDNGKNIVLIFLYNKNNINSKS